MAKTRNICRSPALLPGRRRCLRPGDCGGSRRGFRGRGKMGEAAASPTTRQIFKVALASIVGSVIEQYDFLVTGVIAATVWGDIFFKLPGVAAVAAAISVYGIGIIIR